MQINPINNDTSFKACYKVPYEGYAQLIKTLKYEGGHHPSIYTKPNGVVKDIALFTYSFPCNIKYCEEIDSMLRDNDRITKEEAEELGLKWNIFRKLNIFGPAFLPQEIIDKRLEEIRKKGIDIDSITADESTYITTGDDTKEVVDFMTQRLTTYRKNLFDDKNESDPVKLLEAIESSQLGPKLPKWNFLQIFINQYKIGMKKVAILLKHQLVRAYIDNPNISGEVSRSILEEMKALQLQLNRLLEPRYVQNARILVDQFNQEKKNFFESLKDTKITTVDSVEELLKRL